MERCHLTMAGEIDMANAEDYLALARAIIAGCHAEADTCLTIDLSGVTFMSSSGLNMLVEVRRATTDAGMELRLVRIPEREPPAEEPEDDPSYWDAARWFRERT